ncbi:MAG TPA: 2-hydroxychromene-2-carboxylate isomerase [Solirubrobacteraceae bacterium]
MFSLPNDPTFYFDIGSPYAYLAGQRLPAVLPGTVRWQPVLLGGLFRLTGRSSWALGDPERRQRGMAEIERRARAYGLPPMRWPDPWPGDYLVVMRAATFAFTIGQGHEFARAAWARAFQQGVELSDPANVLDLAAEIGLSHEELAAAVADPEVKRALRDATEAAHAAGVFGVPTMAVGGELFWGDDRLEDAAGRM